MVEEIMPFENQEQSNFVDNLALYIRVKNLEKSALKLIEKIEGEKKNENTKS